MLKSARKPASEFHPASTVKDFLKKDSALLTYLPKMMEKC
jgi:hypothetical protein